MTIASKLQVLAAIKAAQYEAIIAKGGTLSPGDWSAYAAAIAALPSGGGAGVPAVIANMPFTAGDEPLGGTVWYVRPDGAGDRDGRDWDNAFETRAEAVNAASPGDQVRVWEGTYYLEQIQTPKAGVSEYYGFNDDGSWAKRQPFTKPSKHDAQFAAYSFENASVTFLDEQIIDGLWVQNAVKSGNGGGVYLNVRSYLRNCAITNCRSGTYGGGVYVNSSSRLTNCAITNNSGTYGGGVYASSSCVLNNCVVTNNSGTSGGGVFGSSGAKIDKCVVMNNTSSQAGGGVWVQNSGSILSNCIVTNNNSSSQGGGVFGQNISVITNCIVTNNSGSQGGGIVAADRVSLYNVTAAMNKATTGDNFYLVNNSQILYNCCSWGGNIYLAQANYAYKIYNCASNFALTGVTNWHTQADVQNFLPLSAFPFAAPGTAPYDGSGALYHAGTIGRSDEALAFIDRLIAPKMLDAHLPAGSPLIGAGYYEAGVTPNTDADGKERPITPSIGAYEP